MIRLNDNFENLSSFYLFSEVAKKINAYKKENPDAEIIKMDIGDVSCPLFPCVIKAMHEAVDDMSKSSTFHGYGPEQGYPFLREKIAEFDYHQKGISINFDDIFISDGAKCDLGNLGELFSKECKVAIMNPSYPAYADDAVMDGRGGKEINGKCSGIVYLDCDPSNNFVPSLPTVDVDIIYLCFPNNPTGEGITIGQLTKWIEYARRNKTLLIFDSAYCAYIRTPGVVKSIYEIEGADEVAIEIRSFSKTAGFTGIRCGYTVVPGKIIGKYSDGKEAPVRNLWLRRQTTKFNGTSYISQRGAAAIYTEEGEKCVRENTDYYLNNAKIIRNSLEKKGIKTFGGIDSPYVWTSLIPGLDAWEQFRILLEKCGLTSTPGIGFGSNGSHYIRLTGFNSLENTERAVERLEKINLF